MEIWSLIGSLGRRWRIVVPMLVVTFAASGTVALTARPNYEVTGTSVVMLGTPPEGSDGTPVNPWITADSAASQFASLMIGAVSGRDFEERVGALGVPNRYLLVTDPERPAVVGITVTAPSEEIAFRAHRALRDAFAREIEDRQRLLKAPVETRYVLYDLTVPGEAKVIRTRVKLSIGLAGLGCIVSVLCAALAELGAAVRRQRQVLTGEPLPVRMGVVPP